MTAEPSGTACVGLFPIVRKRVEYENLHLSTYAIFSKNSPKLLATGISESPEENIGFSTFIHGLNAGFRDAHEQARS